MAFRSRNLAKRIFDLTASAFAIIFLIPIMFLIGCCIIIHIGSPIFFSQKRVGLNGKSFRLIKFRTMTNVRDAQGKLLPDSERLTNLGKFLRETSIDEFPSLWNVIKGDMSIVGPRPLLPEYLPLYSSEQARRHIVKPGITGWAQIKGRNTLSWEEKFKLDIWYISNSSFWVDLRIILLTFVKVLKRDGISPKGNVTMPKFTGSKKKFHDEN